MLVLVLLQAWGGCGRAGYDAVDMRADGGFSGDAAGSDGGGAGLMTQVTCADIHAGETVGESIASGALSGGSGFTAGCAPSTADGPDVVIGWRAPATGIYQFVASTDNDAVLSVRPSSCMSPELACNDDGGPSELDLDAAVSVPLEAGQEVAVIVDERRSGAGSFQLDAHLKCPGIDLGSALGAPVATGSTMRRGDTFGSSCGGSGESDVAYHWTAPASGSFRFETSGSTGDRVLILFADCDSGPLACNDDGGFGSRESRIDHTFAAGDEVIVVVDTWGAQAGGFELSITAN